MSNENRVVTIESGIEIAAKAYEQERKRRGGDVNWKTFHSFLAAAGNARDVS